MTVDSERFEAEEDVRERAILAFNRAALWHLGRTASVSAYGKAWNADRAGVVRMAQGVARHIDHMRALGGFPAQDYVLGPGVASILGGMRTMLDGELYGLDGGTLWTMLDDLAKAAGWASLDDMEG